MAADPFPMAPLGDVVEVFDSMRIPVKQADRKPGPYPYYGASGIVDYVDSYIFDGEYLLLAEDGENLRSQNTPIAFMATGKFWVNNHAHVLRGNANSVTRFLCYALQVAEIRNYLSGSTRPKLTQGDMKRIPVSCPSIAEQQAIACILGTLDDKIELNRRMNQTLEGIAQAFFKSWFVDFDPVRARAAGEQLPGLAPHIADLFPDEFEESELGEIPKGWRVATLGGACQVIDCLHSKKPERRDGGLPLLQLSNIRNDGLMDMADTYFIDHADYGKWISRMEASPGDCVITNVGRVGAVAQVPRGLKAALGRNMTGIRCKPHFPFPTFLIECLLSDALRAEIARNIDTGTILDALNVRNVPKLRFAMSSYDILQHFEQISRPLRARMEDALAESHTLAALRDTLLPKLISGELRVPDAERFVGEGRQNSACSATNSGSPG